MFLWGLARTDMLMFHKARSIPFTVRPSPPQANPGKRPTAVPERTLQACCLHQPLIHINPRFTDWPRGGQLCTIGNACVTTLPQYPSLSFTQRWWTRKPCPRSPFQARRPSRTPPPPRPCRGPPGLFKRCGGNTSDVSHGEVQHSARKWHRHLACMQETGRAHAHMCCGEGGGAQAAKGRHVNFPARLRRLGDQLA